MMFMSGAAGLDRGPGQGHRRRGHHAQQEPGADEAGAAGAAEAHSGD